MSECTRAREQESGMEWDVQDEVGRGLGEVYKGVSTVSGKAL